MYEILHSIGALEATVLLVIIAVIINTIILITETLNDIRGK